MDDEFEYMVTPLVFNLQLNLNAEGYKIEKVYGSPEANEATGELMKVNTLFPSPTTEEGTKGGLVLLKLTRISQDATMQLNVSYENRKGEVGSSIVKVNLPNESSDYYENLSLRKGVLLARYADLLKNWMIDERGTTNQPKIIIVPIVNDVNGIPVPGEEIIELNKWEHQSVPLKVSEKYKQVFEEFKQYFENEKQAIGDDTLSKETDLLDKLINSP